MAWKRLPELVVSVPELVGQVVAKGCTQLAEAEGRLSEEVRKARMIGQVALTFGGRQVRREVDARLADARRKAEGVAGFIPGVCGDGGSNGAGARPGGATVTAAAATTATAPSSPASGPAPPKPTGARPATKAPSARTTPAKAAPRTGSAAKATEATKATKAAKESAAKAPSSAAGPRRAASRTPGAASAADLPIREYDGLSASQVVSRLTGLTPDELRSVRAYEEGSRGRRTVLLAIDRLLG